MSQVAKKIILLLTLCFLLASCRYGVNTVSPATTQNSTVLSVSQLPVQGSVTPLMSTAVPELTPTRTPVFYDLTEWPLASYTSTAIAMPEMQNNDFSLQSWNETDAIELIKVMDEYARDMDIPGPSLSCGYFEWAQRPVESAVAGNDISFPEFIKF
ncbi:MAG: hypothetical protein QM730_06630 [Anaerolineales bacterium]